MFIGPLSYINVGFFLSYVREVVIVVISLLMFVVFIYIYF